MQASRDSSPRIRCASSLDEDLLGQMTVPRIQVWLQIRSLPLRREALDASALAQKPLFDREALEALALAQKPLLDRCSATRRSTTRASTWCCEAPGRPFACWTCSRGSYRRRRATLCASRDRIGFKFQLQGGPKKQCIFALLGSWRLLFKAAVLCPAFGLN